MSNSFGKIKQSWEEASQKLGFKIIFDMEVVVGKGKYKSFAFVPEFGSKAGAFIGLRQPEDGKAQAKIFEHAKKIGAHFSMLYNEAYSSYEQSEFIETLVDWGYYGSAPRPSWMAELHK
jgi:hypothetical protein